MASGINDMPIFERLLVFLRYKKIIQALHILSLPQTWNMLLFPENGINQHQALGANSAHCHLTATVFRPSQWTVRTCILKNHYEELVHSDISNLNVTL